MTETAATRFANTLVDGAWTWLDQMILGGIQLIIILFIVTYTILTRNIFRRQLTILKQAVDDKSRGLYLEHLPIVYTRIDNEVKKLEELIKTAVEGHDKDMLFLLQEQYRLETLLKGQVSPTVIEMAKMEQNEEVSRALELLLAQLRRNLNK